MNKDGDLLSFLDLLDLDEEVIDLRAKIIMKKEKLSNEHLRHFIYLLQYKHLINIREDSECENDEEFNFLGKLIDETNNENVEAVCKIINLVLTLNPSTVINKSEHLLQQILSEIYLPPAKKEVTDENGDDLSEELQKTLIYLKICGSILDAVKRIDMRLSLPFLCVPLEKIICSGSKQLEVFFLTNTVPRFFEITDGYNILDRVWNFLKELNGTTIALRVICSLSNYYLPDADKSGNIVLESAIVTDPKFWDFILSGLLCKDQWMTLRKQSIYLTKRAIDYIVTSKKDVSINSQCTFIWSHKNEKALKKMWENYFILIDSLEEKQSNIVLPSLKLFDCINDIGHCWLTVAFNIGLQHDNFQVRQKCLNYRFQYKICNESEALTVLEAMNDSTLFENRSTNNYFITRLKTALSDVGNLINLLQGIAVVNWSPVPLFSLTSYLAEQQLLINDSDQKTVAHNLSKILKIRCNNVVMRKAIYTNISYFIANCCKKLPWREYITMFPSLDIGYRNDSNAFVCFIENDLTVPPDDDEDFVEVIKSSHMNIPFALIYYRSHNDVGFLKAVNNMVDGIQDISSRQYSNKTVCLDDAIFVAHLYIYDNEIITKMEGNRTFQAIFHYITSLLSNEVILDFEKVNILLEGFGYVLNYVNFVDYMEILIQLYKSAEILLKDSKTDLRKKLLSLLTLSTMLKSPFRCQYGGHTIEAFVNIIQNKHLSVYNREDGGRLRNCFYEKLCELLYMSCTNGSTKDVIYFIDTVVECGGHGCLKWLLKTINRIISETLDRDEVEFDLVQFLGRVWGEIADLKSNGQYSACMEQFVALLTQDAVLKRPIYNNVVVYYCTKITEYASLKYSPLYFLVKRLDLVDISSYSHMIYVLSDVLLYANVPNKEQRRVQFNSHIQYLAVSVLSKISDTGILNTIMCTVRSRIDVLLRNKLRYHENSYLQRSIESAVQCLLFILRKSREVDVRVTAAWCMELLGRLPHQPYIRTCLEWYICLYFYLEGHVMDDGILQQLKSKNVPLQSQFVIIYWLLKRKIKSHACLQTEFDHGMEFLTSHSMGPTYSVRLQAQYLASKLYEANGLTDNRLDATAYTYIIKVIRSCLSQAWELREKSFMKLANCYFVNAFDVVGDLSFCAVYYHLPIYQKSDASRHMCVTKKFLEAVATDVHERVGADPKGEFPNELGIGYIIRVRDDDEMCEEVDAEEPGAIQKKYIPWKSMGNDDEADNDRPKSELVLVASLIDRLPNLGGMARTGEVFAVQTYVVDSLRHLQNKLFQDLSVSAERWLNVEEVRPGEPLKEYLLLKRSEGYTIVAVEQTSTSVELQDYKFPKKTLLLLGHEKAGVPCALLALCARAVRVPQRGRVRSLNVHVAAALAVWEYSRQHVL